MRAAYRVALVLALTLAPALADKVTIKLDEGLPRVDFLRSTARATGQVVLAVKEPRLEEPLSLSLSCKVPRDKAADLLFAIFRVDGLEHRRYAGVIVVRPLDSLATKFECLDTETSVEFRRPPTSFKSNYANTLTEESAAKLLAMLKGKSGQRRTATRLLGLFGPRTPQVVDALVGVLDADPSEVVDALGLIGYHAKRALPALKKLNKPEFRAVIAQIEYASHPDLTMPGRCRTAAPDEYRVRFDTSKGPFIVKVHRKWAPLAADRFYHLVRIGYFDDTAIHRVIENFVVQWGKSNDPKVNAAWAVAAMRDEPRKENNARGRLSFAKAGPNTRTTQVFINMANNATLDRQGFAPFGEVVEGLETAEQFFAGYANKVNQGRYHFEGIAYVERNFPKLDRIRRAVLLPK